MPALALLQRFVAWRWTPSIALVFGAAAFAGLAILVIPDELGAAPVSAARLARERVAVEASSEEGVDTTASEAESLPTGETAAADLTQRMHAPGRDVVRSIFHRAKAELPIAPVDPEPQPPPPPPPPPPETATVYTIPNAPPPAAVEPTPPGAVPQQTLEAPVNHP
jgi:hypothetical protein